jgi:hypothetical protein
LTIKNEPSESRLSLITKAGHEMKLCIFIQSLKANYRCAILCLRIKHKLKYSELIAEKDGWAKGR